MQTLNLMFLASSRSPLILLFKTSLSGVWKIIHEQSFPSWHEEHSPFKIIWQSVKWNLWPFIQVPQIPCLYKLNMRRKMEFIISPPFKSPTCPPLIPSFLRTTSPVLQTTTVSKACHFQLFLPSSSYRLSHPIESTPAKHLACIFFLSFFFYFHWN